MPIKYRSLKANLRYAGLSSALVVLLTYISLLGHFYAFELVDGQCTRPSYMSELGKLLYFHYSASFVYCGLPSSLIFMFNLAILYFMRKQNNNSKAGGGGANSALRTEREQAITRILLLMSFAFLIFTAIAMVFLYYTQLYLAPQLEDGQPRVGQLYVALRQLAELPATWNVSFNFTFYLAGSRIFRKGFTDMLQSYFCCRKPNGNPSNQ
ncbi:uncharacterized protein LOC134840820 [Symsagittifera roscoffensis]|uniref:uncharacterized protein LOC134840820 n=1 Tax=Symsagittifera roscoffensis TaxID=84072 RepID=UPI00307B5F64